MDVTLVTNRMAARMKRWRETLSDHKHIQLEIYGAGKAKDGLDRIN